MHIYSVMPQISRANSIRKNDRVQSDNQTMPVAMSVPPPRIQSGIILSFTGNDKNVHQFASYAPENKRFGVKTYNAGGLGVVSQEAPVSWRIKEGADVRDFAPYHSYNNADGGVTVVKLTKNKRGIYNDRYPVSSFISAKQNETLEDIAKRVKLKEGEELSYAIRVEPDHKGMSQIIRLEDAGIQGSFTRPADNSITKTKNVTYRLFRAVDIADSADIPVNNYKKKILNEVTKPIKEEITAQIREKYKEQLQKAADEDKKLTENEVQKLEEYKKSHSDELINTSVDVTTNRDKIEAKIKKEIDDILDTNDVIKRIDDAYNTKLNSEEVQNKIKALKSTINAAPEVKERNAAYFIHTEDLAKLDTAYGAGGKGYSAYGAYGTTGSYSTGTYNPNESREYVSTNVAYADNNRAFVEIMPKLNTEAHGYYNPANWWLHDRPAFMVMNAIADESYFGNDYYNGLKVHGTFHNPGRDYQGAESNPFEFFRMVARKEDIDALNKHKQVEKLRKIESKWANATKEEKSFVYQIMRPFMANFLDDYVDTANDIKTFNISMTPVAGTKINPQNMSCGTVSVNYGKEMKSLSTPDIAQFMTTKLAGIKTIDITNGSTPANLRLNDPTANFCQGNNINGLTQLKAGFTPYEYKPVYDEAGKLVSDNIEEVLSAKTSNTKWLLNSLGDAFEKGGTQGITKMFFTDKQIADNNASVIGHLSKYQEGDMLFMGWGRPDPQKGYPSTFQAFLDFLKDPNVDKEVKKHTKLIVGAGVWEENARDYKWVKDIIRQLEELDGGIYKGNACYVNGFFPNRLVGCATYSIFTSRFEPCGITPLESFAAGTPVVSTNTGGAPDFIAATRGYLTKHPYLRTVEDLKIDPAKLEGKPGEELGNIIDAERMLSNASEVKECVSNAVSDYGLKAENGKLSKYAEMVRDCLQQKIDWHENAAYNGGKSANERYMTEVFEVDKGMNTRNFEKLKRLVGQFGTAVEENSKKLRNKWTKIIIGTGIVIAAAGTAAYAYMKRSNKQDKQDKQDTQANQQQKTQQPVSNTVSPASTPQAATPSSTNLLQKNIQTTVANPAANQPKINKIA